MDVRVYPPPPQPLAASEHARLGQLSYSDPSLGNKLDGDTMFLGVSNTSLDFPSTNQFRVPQPLLPSSKLAPPTFAPPTLATPWRRDNAEAHRLPWPFSLGDEEFHIPPITPPTLPDHMLPPHHPADPSVSGSYHPLAPHAVLAQRSHPSYQLQGMDMPVMTGGHGSPLLSQEGDLFGQDGGPMTSTLSVMQQMVNSDLRFTSSQQPIDAALGPRSQSGLGQQGQLTTINQSQLGLEGNSTTHDSPSPPGSKSATPSPCSSIHDDENEDALRGGVGGGGGGEKRPAAFDTPKKAKTPKKKKRKDPNEPIKPVSAYALFFRDTQANIKAQNPSATFGEVSKIVASMWDGLGEEQKQEYKKRTETAKKEYLKQLAAYRASLVSQSYNHPSETKPSPSSSPPPSAAMFTHPGHQGQQPSSHPGHQGQQSSTHPGHQGQHPSSHPGHQGQQSSTHPGHQGQHPSSHPGHQGQHPSSHPSHQGQHPSSHPGHQGQQSSTHPGHQGQQPSTHPGHQGQHPSSHPHPGHHPGMYPPYPHPHSSSHPSHSPSLSPHLHTQLHPQFQGLSSRGAAPRPNLPQQGALSVGSIAAASPPPHQVSPPLHSQAHLGGLHSPHHQNHQNHQMNPHHSQHQNQQNLHHSQHQNHIQHQLTGHPLGMTHAAITQGYPLSLQSDYQSMGGGMLGSRVMMSSSVDYHQLVRPAAAHQALDWSAEYHSSGGVPRDKPLFLS